jgi:hypothetical protein
MSSVLWLHVELAEDGAAQAFADFLVAVTWKRCLFPVQVDLGCFAPSTKRAPNAASCFRNSEHFMSLSSWFYMCHFPFLIPRTQSLVRVSDPPIPSPGWTTAEPAG